ncbi:hypothetical protein HY086_01020 [Candidatus Gottesmanbacteria bacterium]|nr:hypothetical protein [Candidatus Gottesmanbacteria bacterium]
MKKILAITFLALLFFHSIVVAQTTDIKPFLNQNENRVDRNGDGIFDSYWSPQKSDQPETCAFSLYDITERSKIWTAILPSCGSLFELVFHTKSFIGDGTRDFTVIGKGTSGGDLDFWLWVGDGATGQVRDFKYFMGNAVSPGIVRLNGIQVVDFQLPQYRQPFLLVRTTGDGFYGHLFYFPPDGLVFEEVTGKFFNGTPFPGVDMPDNKYTEIYDSFNRDLVPCESIKEGSSSCGVPDTGSGGKGSGYFLDQVAVGDLDVDGIDDVLMTFFWRSAAYPGRPKGTSQYIGAPQYDNYYNPQNDGSGCHSGRHYGLSTIVPVDGFPYPVTVNIGGTPVNNFLDVYQNVSRNIGVIGTMKHAILPTFERKLLWNVPMGTSIPNCGANNTAGVSKLYDGSLHIPSDGMMKNQSGKVLYVDINYWTQNENFPVCDHGDIACHNKVLSTQSGNWAWRVLDVKTGTVKYEKSNMYVWDTIPDPEKGGVWIVYSNSADIWNLGFTTIDGKQPLLREDLAVGFFNTNTLSITNVQPFPGKTRVFLKYTRRQNIGRSVISGGWAFQLFRFPNPTGLPDFLLVIPDGYVRYAFHDGKWIENGRYSTSGDFISSSKRIPGDLDNNGKVDIFDYNLLVANFGKTGVVGFTPADIDKNGKVDIFDYNILVGNFGK